MRKFFKTVAIVTIFSACEKFLGFLYRIYLSRSIGAEGMGLYQVALSVFGLIYTICCSGTPVTVSRLMTKYRAEGNEKGVRQIITAGLSFVVAVSIPVCILFIFTGKYLTFLFTDQRCIKIFTFILPGLIFTSIYSVLRGVFWGNKEFFPYSIIELLEEACMIICGIILIEHATDVYQGAFRAGVAVTISYLFSFTLASAYFLIKKNKLARPKGQFRPLLSSALPITFMRTTGSITSSLVSVILPIRLVASGLTSAQAMSSIGAAMGQAFPLLYVPTTLIGSLSLVLVPEIAENYYKKRHDYLRRDVEKSVKFTIFLTCLFIPVFTVFGEQIGVLVFKGHLCGEYLSASAFLMIFISVSSITTGILNSMGAEKKTLICNTVGGLLMLACAWFLPTYLGTYSLIVGFVFVHGISTVVNVILINKYCVQKPRYLKFLFLSLLFLLPTAFIGLLLKRMLLLRLGSFLTVLICSVIMLTFNVLLYFGFNLLNVNLIKKSLPKNKKLAFRFSSLKLKKL